MTGLHLYCLVPADRPVSLAPRGLDGSTVEAVRVDDLAVWCSRRPRRPRPDLARVRAHDRVVRAAASDRTTPLPFRFGQWLQDEADLVAKLRAGAGEYRRRLGEVAGALEFSVRIHETGRTGSEPPEPPRVGGAGSAYLRDLARDKARREARTRECIAVLGRLHGEVEGRTRQVRVDPVPARGSVASAAHLVSRDAIPGHREAVEAFAGSLVGLELHLTGPWAPYSFARADDDSVRTEEADPAPEVADVRR